MHVLVLERIPGGYQNYAWASSDPKYVLKIDLSSSYQSIGIDAH